MIRCSVCGRENDDLAVLCTQCKSYLQSKVDTLDLFGTIWMLIERPRHAMKRVALARYKNYTYFLSALFGIALLYAVMWYRNLAKVYDDLFVLLAAGLLIGPVVGIFIVVLSGFLLTSVARLMRGKATARNMRGVLAYSTVPIALSLVFIFPVEIAIFGRAFFDNNPPPMVIKPLEYVVLVGLDALAVLWSLFLLLEGIGVASGFGRGRSALVVAVLLALMGLFVAGLHYYL